MGLTGGTVCSGIAAGAFALAALTDLARRRIANRLVGLAAAAWVGAALAGGLGIDPPDGIAPGGWPAAAAALATGLAAFLAMLACYRFGWVGGGDVKLAGVVLLWAGPALAPAALTVIALSGLALTLTMLATRPLRRRTGGPAAPRGMLAALDDRRGVPYGVPLALGGLAVTLPPWLGLLKG
ncbi:prepilin peptidase [Phaeospirillum tilakii]|uniref:Prepilin peptidase n=1 Tax=Phaeospirillum tilakii TaxID=741673 RepID=A0ABW5CE58_9PROT